MVFDRVSRLASILGFAPALGMCLALYLVFVLPAAATSLLRDPDIENGLSQLAKPILRSAGLNPNRVRILVVDDSSLNAFVIDSQTIFVHYGLIQKVSSPEALQAVLAHEAAHIANGHIARRMGNLRGARTLAGLGTALAVIAAAAGAGDAAAGIAVGTSSSAQRAFLAHTRAEESSADRSAGSYMRSAGINPQGLVELHNVFRGQENLNIGRQDPFMQSHPLSHDRIRAAQAFVDAQGSSAKTNSEFEYWFNRIKGKLTAFNRNPKWTMGQLKSEKTHDVRLMRQAVAFHRLRDLANARAAIDAALTARPNDPYYYELKGQIMMENRQWSAALSAYEKAVELAPDNALIQGGYGHALLASGHPKSALVTLEKARARDFRDMRVLRDLSIAYAKTTQTGMAALVTGERYALQGRMHDAGINAKRAIRFLPRGSTAWQRAQDVLIASEQFEKRKKR